MKKHRTRTQRTPASHARAAPQGFGRAARELWDALDAAELQARGLMTLRTTTVPKPPSARSCASLGRIRRRAGMSQGVLAGYLNVSVKTVQSWEQGTRIPKAGEARLIQLFASDPAGFRRWVEHVG